MTAVRMSHDRHKLADISRELYFEHGWKMPQGLIDPELRNPLNFDRQEWFKAKRTGKDPRDIKAVFQQCWASSDSGKAFRHAMEQRGYYLARGDSRAVVAVDLDGEVYAVARWTGLRSKAVVARIGDTNELPSVAETQTKVAALVREKLSGFVASVRDEFAKASDGIEARRIAMVQHHRTARAELRQTQGERGQTEAKERAARFRKGLSGLWDRVTGRHKLIRERNEREAEMTGKRDADEADALIAAQLHERRELQHEIRYARRLHIKELTRLHRSLASERFAPGIDVPDKNDKHDHQRRRRRRRGLDM